MNNWIKAALVAGYTVAFLVAWPIVIPATIGYALIK